MTNFYRQFFKKMNTLIPKTKTSQVHLCAMMSPLEEYFHNRPDGITGRFKKPNLTAFDQKDLMAQFCMCRAGLTNYIHFMTTKKLHLNSL